ncbi:MAG TPA: 2-hydroxyhepta-2,4-diene-1,7-dioate isomerase, partial [Chryseolinea sp.]
MRVYKVKQGIILEKDKSFFHVENQNWDTFINDDNLFVKTEKLASELRPSRQSRESMLKDIQAPIQNQEVWASGVTYLRSKVGRQEESKNAGGSDFYARVYEAERPELFFKATPGRVVGPGGQVRI